MKNVELFRISILVAIMLLTFSVAQTTKSSESYIIRGKDLSYVVTFYSGSYTSELFLKVDTFLNRNIVTPIDFNNSSLNLFCYYSGRDNSGNLYIKRREVNRLISSANDTTNLIYPLDKQFSGVITIVGSFPFSDQVVLKMRVKAEDQLTVSIIGDLEPFKTK